MSSNHRVSASSLAWLCLALVTGCAAAPVQWLEGGVPLGTIHATQVDGGQRLAYRDLDDRLVRVEYRTTSGDLDGARPVEHREYDDAGRMWHVYFTDGSGRKIPGPGGFAARRTKSENVDGVRSTHI